jgi:uncharacterized protein YbaR (Trm112 family)
VNRLATLVAEGVFEERADGSLGFVAAAAPPTDVEVARLLVAVRRRIVRLVRRHGIELDRGLEEEQGSDGLALDNPALAEIRGASVLGRVATGPRAGQRVLRLGADPTAPVVSTAGPRHAHLQAFDLHANVAVRADQRVRLEKLCRYVLRPPVAQDALELTAEGKVLLRLGRPWRDGTRAIRFEPSELLERLAALVPRPRAHLLLYHGAFAPRGCCREGTERWPNEQSVPKGSPTPGGQEKGALGGAPSGAAPQAAIGLSPAADPGTEGSAAPRAPPEDFAYVRPRYFRWAELLARVFEVDILACPDCGGRLGLVATIEQRAVIEKILAHLALPTELPSPVLSTVYGPVCQALAFSFWFRRRGVGGKRYGCASIFGLFAVPLATRALMEFAPMLLIAEAVSSTDALIRFCDGEGCPFLAIRDQTLRLSLVGGDRCLVVS